MSESLDPAPLFDLIAQGVPDDLLNHIIVVGSLAAAYHFRGQLANLGVNTKDADFVIQPAGALEECRAIAGRLLKLGWRKHQNCSPMTEPEPVTELRAIRLYPPDHDLYFIELLGFPAIEQIEPMIWISVKLLDGWYGLPTFRYMGLTQFSIQSSKEGLKYAAPSMMALANLLSHPSIGPERMGMPIGGRTLLRSAKDLGRVLGLAHLSNPDDLEIWPELWASSLQELFPTEAAQLAQTAGNGLRAMLDNEAVLDEARHALDIGLLAGRSLTNEQLKATGRQLFTYSIDPLAKRFA